jgi:hypothetical protein
VPIMSSHLSVCFHALGHNKDRLALQHDELLFGWCAWYLHWFQCCLIECFSVTVTITKFFSCSYIC